MKKKKCKRGGAVSSTGYLPTSPDRFNDFNIIPSDIITMNTVPHDILGISDTGEIQLMKKNSGEYKFKDAKTVTEIPIKNIGGELPASLPERFKMFDEHLSKIIFMQMGGQPFVPATAFNSVFDINGQQPAPENNVFDLKTLGKNLPASSVMGQTGYKVEVPGSFRPATKEEVSNFLGELPQTSTQQPMYKNPNYTGDSDIAQMKDAPKMFNPVGPANSNVVDALNGNVKLPKPKKSLSGVEQASLIVGGMSILGNQLEKIQDSKVTKMLREKGTTDAQFSNYHPTNARGYIDVNSGRMDPTKHTLTQFSNAPVEDYYGQPASMPIKQVGGMIPEMIQAPINENPISLPAYSLPNISNPVNEYANTAGVNYENMSSLFSEYSGLDTSKDGKSAATRGNNPGNIVYGSFTKKYGAVPGVKQTTVGNETYTGNSSYAKFPTVEAGLQAAYDLLNTKGYKNLTVSQAINKWVNGDSSKSSEYTSAGVKMFGDAKISALSPDQLKKFVIDVIAKNEDGKMYRKLKSNRYKEGGEYNVSDSELKRLRDLGYEVEML